MELSTGKPATEPASRLSPGFSPWFSTVFTDRRVAALTTLSVASLVMILGSRTAPGWSPTTDWALIELRVRDVGRSFPLLGAPSAFGFHHPGPLMYLLLAPVYRLAGSNPSALILSTAAVNTIAIVGCSWTAWRRGGLPLVLSILALSIGLSGSAEPGFLFDAWNPWLAVMWFMWFLLLAWSLLDGDLLALPVGAFVGSFVVQAHVSYVLPVLGVSLIAAGITVTRHYRTPPGERPAKSVPSRWLVAATAAALAAVWAGPLFEQVTRDPGNVTRMARILGNSEGRGQLVGMWDAVGLTARQLSWNGPWTGAAEPIGLFNSVEAASKWHLLVPLGAVIAAVLLTTIRFRPVRTDDQPVDGLLASVAGGSTVNPTSVRSLVVVTVVAGVLFVAAVSRIEADRVFPYMVRGLWVVAGLIALSPLLAGFGAAERRWPTHARRVRSGAIATGMIGVVAVSARLISHSSGAQLPVYESEFSPAQVSCNRQLVAAVQRDAGAASVHMSSEEFWPVHAGPMVNELDRSGTDVEIAPRLSFYVDRPGQSPSTDAEAYTVVDLIARPTWSGREGTRLVECDGLTPDERTFIDAIGRDGVPSEADQQRAVDLAPRNIRVAVYRR